ncbi:MAG: HDOD domain-containing protein [Desulfobacterales bacterium]|nr:HDOD domain-containing protein [Desulfobacterales bacterium]
MGSVRIKELKAGMVLADDVTDIKGRLLLPKGRPIGPDHIRIFKIWGVARVNVMGGPKECEPAGQPIDPARLEAIRRALENRFRLTDRNHPVVQEIFAQALQARASDLFPAVNAAGLPEPAPEADGVSQPREDFFQKFIEKEILLPEIPTIVMEMNEVIANPLSTADQMAQVVNKSPSLTAQLLRIVNSAFYGLPTRVDRVSLAVTLIGTRELSALALGISIMSLFKIIPSRLLNMQLFLQHSLACGIVCRLLAAHKAMRHTEQMFTAGLLHDIGRLVICIHFPEEILECMGHAALKGTSLFAAEMEKLGCHHGHIGKYLLHQWRLPLSLENNASCHHEPTEAPDPAAAALVHVADLLVNALGIGSSGERCVPPLDPRAWEDSGLSSECFETVVQQTAHQFKTLEFLLQTKAP